MISTELDETTGAYAWVIFAAFAAIVAFGINYLEVQVNSQEPPKLRIGIPILGHIIGMLKHGALYHKKLDEKCQKPIYTVTIFSYKSYVITDPNLAQAAIRHKNFSFDPIAQGLSIMLLGLTQETAKAIRNKPANEKDPDWSHDTHKVTSETLKPGPGLDWVVSRVLQGMGSGLAMVGQNSEFEEHNLFLWMRDLFTPAISSSLYGFHDPFSQDPSLVQAFWDYEDSVAALMFTPLPYLFVRRGYLARQRIHAALRAWFYAGRHLSSDVSGYVRGRIGVSLKHGFTHDEAANELIGVVFVATINAVPTLYWMLVYILSDPSVAQELRAEVEGIAERQGNECILDIDNLASRCPVLVSAYHETMRLTNYNTGMRQVMEDTLLTYEPPPWAGESTESITYLLKKGYFVQSPASVLQTSAPIWDPDASSFKARRFLSPSISNKQKKAFIPFGGGRHLCPGRHLAFSEILGTVAMILLGYEVRDIGGGDVKFQEKWYLKIVDAVPRPDSAHAGKGFKDVKVKRRVGWEGVRWQFRVGGHVGVGVGKKEEV